MLESCQLKVFFAIFFWAVLTRRLQENKKRDLTIKKIANGGANEVALLDRMTTLRQIKYEIEKLIFKATTNAFQSCNINSITGGI